MKSVYSLGYGLDSPGVGHRQGQEFPPPPCNGLGRLRGPPMLVSVYRGSLSGVEQLGCEIHHSPRLMIVAVPLSAPCAFMVWRVATVYLLSVAK